jgi:uracil-DNA glycosylase
MHDVIRRALEHEIALAGPEVYVSEIHVSEIRSSQSTFSPDSLKQGSKLVKDVLPIAPIAADSSIAEPPPVYSQAVPYVIDTVPADGVLSRIPSNSPLLEIQTLEELEQYVRKTVLISLDETRTNPVFGVGNPEADVMVIGEAPGADEDAQGEPFVGRAGQLLNQILKAIGFEREEVYIANILKSRPPNNRNPLPEEIAAHEPVLYRQISLIRPKIILTVGLVSAGTLLRSKASLTSLRQRVHDFHGTPLLATYHPAALLRNPNWKRPTWEDVQLLREHYDRLMAEANI